MSSKLGLGYINRCSPVHSLTGATKFLMAVLSSVAAMITYDTRFLAAMIVGAAIVFKISKIRFREIRFVVIFIAVLMLINSVAIFLFSPEEGVMIYGARHEIAHLFGRYYLTQEQLFYMFNVILKYFSVLPMALLFIVTTQPSEFSSSLNRIGVNYKIACSVALTLRYIPDVKRDFDDISRAQQARGIDMSKDERLIKRLQNVLSVIFPLIFSSLGRIDTISNAMELRGFGKNKTRTWYNDRPYRIADYLAIAFCAVLVAVSIALNAVNGGRFYNPF
ncbi:MAG: energy-coupling factor transporter transmembrane protein EcfT [Oscillospiraceae bacterium]|nr:energy-coupling factor transporter transmembrane protein EcfT [Oscillospiraceae bacterium]